MADTKTVITYFTQAGLLRKVIEATWAKGQIDAIDQKLQDQWEKVRLRVYYRAQSSSKASGRGAISCVLLPVTASIPEGTNMASGLAIPFDLTSLVAILGSFIVAFGQGTSMARPHFPALALGTSDHKEASNNDTDPTSE